MRALPLPTQGLIRGNFISRKETLLKTVNKDTYREQMGRLTRIIAAGRACKLFYWIRFETHHPLKWVVARMSRNLPAVSPNSAFVCAFRRGPYPANETEKNHSKVVEKWKVPQSGKSQSLEKELCQKYLCPAAMNPHGVQKKRPLDNEAT